MLDQILHTKIRKKFILIIGEDGAILTYLNGTQVKQRLFSHSASTSDRRNFHALLTSMPKVPVYILLDTLDQSYDKKTLPAVSQFTIGNLVKKRLERDYPNIPLKDALCIGREETGRKDWIYIFATANTNKNINDWVSYVESLPNKFYGIHLLPVEMSGLVNKINQHYIKESNKKPSKWQILTTYDKTGGFRQTVFKNEKIIFTRLIRPGKDTLPDLLAGTLEQETLNTLEYLRRLNFGEEEKLDAYFVISSEIKKSVEQNNISLPNSNIKFLTPFEVAEIIKLKDVVKKEDKFSDILLAVNFAIKKPTIKLFTKKNRLSYNYLQAYEAISATIFTILPIFLLYAGISFYEIFNLNNNTDDLIKEKSNIEKKWQEAESFGEYNIDDANKITDVVKIYDTIKKESLSPLELITTMRETQDSQAYTKSFTWEYTSSLSIESGAKKGTVSAMFDLEFFNTGDQIEELFNNFDQFTSSLSEKFSNYDVASSKLPDKISFGDRKKIINIQIKLTKPKSTKR